MVDYEEGKHGGGGGVNEEFIIFGLYNIRNVRDGDLESALHGMVQENMDLGVLKEMVMNVIIYMQGLAGYCVIATNSMRRHQ